MKIPFHYQTTEYDCVPTSFTNALLYLFEREEISSDVIRKIYEYSLDDIKHGTTGEAVKAIIQYLKSFSEGDFAFKRCELLDKRKIHFKGESEILSCLNNGGVALVRVRFGKSQFHYTLAIGVDNNWIEFFDPYYRTRQFTAKERNSIIWLGNNETVGGNLKIMRERLDSDKYNKYCIGTLEERECCLIERV